MSKAYLPEEAKLARITCPPWTYQECVQIQDTLYKKGYLVNTCSRVGCDGKRHDAWQIERSDMPQIIEQLFRQRIVVEVQAEGHFKASIIFVYAYTGKYISDVVQKFQKNKGGSL